jgi:hypothetical protein
LCAERPISLRADAQKLVTPVVKCRWIFHLLQTTALFTLLSLNHKNVYEVHKNWLVVEVTRDDLVDKLLQGLAIRTHLKTGLVVCTLLKVYGTYAID